jgi:hypothetical protein
MPTLRIESSRNSLHLLLNWSRSFILSRLPTDYFNASNMITRYILLISLSLLTYGVYIVYRFKNHSKNKSNRDKSVMNKASFFNHLLISSISKMYSDSKIDLTISIFLTLDLNLSRFFLKMWLNLSSLSLS